MAATELLDTLLQAAAAVHPEAQVRFQLLADGKVYAVVAVGSSAGAAEIVRTLPAASAQGAILLALERMRGISTRISLSKIREHLEEARQASKEPG